MYVPIAWLIFLSGTHWVEIVPAQSFPGDREKSPTVFGSSLRRKTPLKSILNSMALAQGLLNDFPSLMIRHIGCRLSSQVAPLRLTPGSDRLH
jgi:hypothetical protein